MNIQRIMSRRARSLYLIMLVMLTATNMGVVHAVQETGIVNGTFGEHGACTLNGWTTSGTVTTAATPGGECYAVLSAQSTQSSGGRVATTTSQLSQRFPVGVGDKPFRIVLRPSSDNPNVTFEAQTVSLHDSFGSVFYKKSRNTQAQPGELYHFSYDLSSRAGQYVELRISVTSSSDSNLPHNVSLTVDFVYDEAPTPETTPGPGW